MPRVSKQERDEAIQRLREIIKEGDTVFTIIRHRSSSGMSRVIQPVLIRFDEQSGPSPLWLGYNVARALGLPYDEKHEGVKMQGTGEDHTWVLVYHLSNLLFGDGRKLRRECL